MKKRILAVILTLAVVLSLVSITALAAGDDSEGDTIPATSGSCGAEGSDVKWDLTANNDDTENPTYTLTISGSGAMADYVSTSAEENHVPWADYTESISEVVIEDGITYIGVRSFDSFTALTSVTIADSVTSIGNRSFQQCSALKSITLPQGITKIEDGTFWHCTNLESINLSAVTSIGKNAFDECALKSVDLTSLTEIDQLAFQECTALADVTFGNEIKTLPTGMFKNCSALTSITLPDSLEEIGSYCFYGTGLTSIDLNNVKTISSTYAFANCTSLQSVVMDHLEGTLPGNTFNGCTALTELTIPSGVTEIKADGVFAGCTALETLTLAGDESSENITLAQAAFSDLSGLTTLYIDRNITNDNTNLSVFKTWDSTSGLDVIFGNHVTTIPQKLLGGTQNTQLINRIVFGEKVTTVDAGAFAVNDTIKMVDMTALNSVPSNISLTMMINGSVIYVSDNNTAANLIGTLQADGQNYAKWKTGVAVLDGGSLAENTEVTLSSLATPIKDGYAFEGWYSDADCTTKVEDNNITLTNQDYGTYYAKWLSTITFDGNGATSGSMTAQEIAEGDATIALTANSFTKTGYTFSGWNTAVDGTGTSYANEATGAGANGNITLYAQWTPNTYTINFSGGTGASGSTASVSATYDQPATLTANGFTKSGYNFAGWATTEDATTATYSDGATVENLTAEANGSVTLYAVWTDKQVLTPDKNVQAKTYNGNPQEFTLEGGYTIAYQQNGSTVTAPTNAGSYDVIISHAGNDAYAPYPATTIPGGLVITPATLDAPVLSGYTATTSSITVTEPTIPTGASKVQYSIDGGSTWQDRNVFSGLTSGTSYSVIAKFVADTSGNYADSANSAALSARTNSSGGGGSSSSTYTVTVDSTKNGSVSVSPKSASKGTTVTITVKPNSGYELDDLTVTDKNGDTVKLTKKSDTQYTFTMPAGKVTVSAAFKEALAESDSPSKSFADVDTSSYYYDAVEWAVENGVTNGTTATAFSPDATCTRAQMVTFLWRAAGSPAPESSVNPFADVPTSAYYYDAVLWAVEQGITNGTSATTFSPDDTVTRGQTVAFLYRAASSPASSGGSFADVAADAYYAPAVQWAVANGITNGTSNTTFSPDAPCTRGQIVTFLYRAYA